MKNLEKKRMLPLVKTALKEDIGRGDITTDLLFPRSRQVSAVIVAKEKGIVAGLDVAALVFKSLHRGMVFRSLSSDGKQVTPGKLLARLKGPAKKILTAERTALNFLGRLSGIATQTNNFVKKIVPYDVKIMDTRKTTPNLRYLEKYAVRTGGGYNHRLGLYDQVLIKGNHVSAYRISPSGISKKFRGLSPGKSSIFSGHIAYRKRILREMIEKMREGKPKGVKIEVEVRNLQEFKQALLAKPHIIMLDNMNIRDIKAAVRLREDFKRRQKGHSGKPLLEVSGRISLTNVRHIARSGVDRISIGSLTHSASSLDIALKICQ